MRVGWNHKNAFLREEIMYPRWCYYLVMVRPLLMIFAEVCDIRFGIDFDLCFSAHNLRGDLFPASSNCDLRFRACCCGLWSFAMFHAHSVCGSRRC